MSVSKACHLISNFIFIVGLIVAGFYLFLHLSGRQPFNVFIVSSGSMEPAIKTGSLVIVAPKSVYLLGDVISFYSDSNNKTTTTHRLVGLSNGVFRVAGDANNTPDPNQVPIEKVVGSVRFTLPYLGYLAAFAKKPLGFILMVIVPATIIIYEELKSLLKESKKKMQALRIGGRREPARYRSEPDQDDVPNRSNSMFKPAIVLPIFFAVLISLSLTVSFFIDRETSTSNVFAMGAPSPTPTPTSIPTAPTSTPTPTPTTIPSPTPTPTPGPGNIVINEINWSGSNGDGNDEWIELKNTTGNPIDLANWVIENLGAGSGPGANITIPSGIIPANGFFLVSQAVKASSKINVDPDFVTTSISLNNGGEQLTLKNNLGTTIDTVNDTGAWFFGSNSTPKKTMERKTPTGDGTQSTNWQIAVTHTNMDSSGPTDEFGTPKSENGI